MQREEFQRQHLRLPALNVGCGDDPARLRLLGAVNLDVVTRNPATGYEFPVDLQCDGRHLAAFVPRGWDTVMLGDVLEHTDDTNALHFLVQARVVLSPVGRIVVTVPEDWRDVRTVHGALPLAGEYVSGVSYHHTHPRTRAQCVALFAMAELVVAHEAPLEYGFCSGHGFVLKEAGR